jgi:hypothetical protein
MVKLACVVLLFGAIGCYDDYGYDTGYAANATVDDTADDYPPDSYIATAQPFYYEGRPAYFYNNRWFYRDGARWNYYRSEPAVLGGYRAQYYGGAYAPRTRINGYGGYGAYGGRGGAIRGGYNSGSQRRGGGGGGGGHHR